jgi:CRP/FNR family cyclic AMP-dependent transcriptional regulator
MTLDYPRRGNGRATTPSPSTRARIAEQGQTGTMTPQFDVERRPLRAHRTGREGNVFVDTAMLREFKIFDELNDRELETIAKAAKWEELGPGARLSEAGTPAKHLYLIVEGLLDVNVVGPHGKSIGADQIGPGQVFGWGAIVGPYIYTASGVTAEKTKFIVFSGSKLREIFEVNNHIGYRVLKGD